MINRLYRLKWFPLVFQVVTFIVFVLLITGGLGITAEDGKVLKQLRNTNLANLIVWSYWWPLIVVTAVSAGRHWCTVCPVELLSALVSRIGFKLKVPPVIKSGWGITLLYAFVSVVAIHTWGIHRSPEKMAFYLMSLMGLAAIISLIFEKRAFCSCFCPVGKLLGLYSLLAKVGIRVKSQNVCRDCKSKDCVSSENSSKLTGRSCTSGLYPAAIDNNRECIVCTQCIKACPNNNIAFRKSSDSYRFFDPDRFGWSEVGMFSILMGFVCYEILSSWKISKLALLSIPGAVYEELSFLPEKTFEAIVLFLILPALSLLLFSGIAKLIGKESLSFYIKRTAGYILPVVAFGHLFKALLKTTSRVPYWEYALDKPQGLEYAEKIVSKAIVLNHSEWLGLAAIILGVTGLLGGFVFSIRKIVNDEKLNTANIIFYILVVLIHMLILLSGPASELMR